MSAQPTTIETGSAMDVAEAGNYDGAVVTMCLDGVHNIMEQLPAMKRARSSWVTEALADTTGPPCVWQVCLTVGWSGAPGVWAGGTGAVGNSDGGATWIDLEGGWKHALELLFYSTQSFSEDIWQVVKALGPAAWPRARLLGLGYPNIEYLHAPPGTREGGDIFQLNTVTGTERSVRRLWLHIGSLSGKVAVGGMAIPKAVPADQASGSATAPAAESTADTLIESSMVG
jgi:hypothetical protein